MIDEETGYYINNNREIKQIRAKENGHYDHGCEEDRLFFIRFNAFLEKSINKPIRNVEADFYKMFPAYLSTGLDTRYFFNLYTNKDEISRGRHYGKYYVNDKGIFKKRPSNRKKKDIVLSKSTTYRFKKEYLKYPEVCDWLVQKIGNNKILDIVESDYLSENLLKDIEEINSDFKWKFGEKLHINLYDASLYIRDTKPEEVIKEGTSEYTKYKKEENDQKKKASRIIKKEKEEKAENLLHNIEEKRKFDIHKTDIVDRDRLGFDNKSFYGEEYHGEKRKKK